MADVTDQEILEVLKFSDSSDDIKKRALNAAHTTVELRMMSLLDDMMDEYQANEFHSIKEERGDGAAWDYLNAMIETDVNDLYQATMRDYLDQHSDD